MEGAARATNRQFDLAIFAAWHTAIFALNGYSGKLKNKKLSDFLSAKPADDRRSKNARGIAFFHSLKARGVPIEITRH